MMNIIDPSRKMRGAKPADKVLAYSIPVTESGCWLWIRKITPTGYGQVFSGTTMEGAHRFSWRAFNGEIPKESCVLHKCDVRCCVNPDHLYLGDHQRNMDDMMERGRHRALSGELNGFVKLTDQQVSEISKLYATGFYTQKMLAEKFGCSQQLVSRIARKEHRNLNQ